MIILIIIASIMFLSIIGVVFVNGNDTLIESIFDNMKGYKTSELKEKYEDVIKSKIKNLSKLRIENMRKKVLKVPAGSKYIINIIDEGVRYDIATNKFYYTMYYEGKYQLDRNSGFVPPKCANAYEEEV